MLNFINPPYFHYIIIFIILSVLILNIIGLFEIIIPFYFPLIYKKITLNNIFYILKLYFKILSSIILLISIYILCNSVSNIVLYIIIYLLILFSTFIIFYKYYSLKLSNKIIINILNKNYIYLLQRMMFIKFILLYLFIASDYTFCESNFIVKVLHDTFVNMGTSVGIKPKETVSTLETLGMCTVIAGVAYCSIKGYQMATNTLPKSTKDHIDQLGNKVNENKDILDYIKVQNEAIIKQNIENHNVLIGLVKLSDHQNTMVEKTLIEIGETLRNDISVLKHDILINTESSNKYIYERIEKLQDNFNFKLNEFKSNVSNIDALSDEDRSILEACLKELEDKLQSDLSIVRTEFERNALNNFDSLIPIPSNIKFRSNLNSKVVAREVDNAINKSIDNMNRINKNIPRLNLNNGYEVKPSPVIYKNYYELSQSNDILTFTKVFNNNLSQQPTGVSTIVRKVFNNIPVDNILKTLYTIFQTSLNNSISVIVTGQIVKNVMSIYKIEPLPPVSKSESCGESLVLIIKNFVKGLYKGATNS